MELPYKIVNGVPVQMTQTEFDAFILDQQTQTAASDLINAANNTALNGIKSTAQSAVGITLANLTAAQQKALMAILLWQAKGVDISDPNNPKVKALNLWVQNNT